MTYRTRVKEIAAYQFLRNPETDPETPYWLLNRVMDNTVRYDKGSGVLWIYPHNNVIGLQQAHEGDYLVYDSAKDEIWVEWKKDFEAKYEAVS